MNETTEIRPSLWYCLLGAPFLLAGAGLFVFLLIHGIAHVTDSLTQVVVPGKAELSLKRGQKYTVFFEEQSIVRGKIYSTTESIAGLGCRVSSIPTGDTVRIGQPSWNTSYTVGGRAGHAVLEFSIQEDGKYDFACDYGANSHGPEAVLAVGSGTFEDLIRTVAGCLAAMFAGGGLCVAVLVTVLIKREGAKNRARQFGQLPI